MSTAKRIRSSRQLQALNLVERQGQKAFTTSLIVAEQCELAHKGVIALVRKFQPDFEELGFLAFQKLENRGTQGASTEYVVLSEDQATYLITLFRNTPIVRRFKLALVKAFRKALDEISRLYANPPRLELLTAKRVENRPMMDALVEFRESLDKETDERHYICESKLCNFIITGRFEALDEKALENDQAVLLAKVRDRNRSYLLSGLSYEDRKVRLLSFALRQRAISI